MSNKTRAKTTAQFASITAYLASTISFTAVHAQQCDPVLDSKMFADDATELDAFGTTMAVDGNLAIVGAWRDDTYGQDAGAAYIFRYNGSKWVEEATLRATDGSAADYFGASVGISGNNVIIGAYGKNGQQTGAGAAYVFNYDGHKWNQHTKLTAADADQNDKFGTAVDIAGDAIIIGAWWDDDLGFNSGSAYVFRFNGSQWRAETKLLAPAGAASDYFGASVACSGNTAIIGTYRGGTKAGYATIFKYDGNQWDDQATVTADDAEDGDRFGQKVDLDGDNAIVGAVGFDDFGSSSGAAYIFNRSENQWAQTARLRASDGALGDHFGNSVTIARNKAIVGMWNDPNQQDRDSVYLFYHDGSQWIEEAILNASNNQSGDLFGWATAITGDTALIGAPNEVDPNGQPVGGIYAYDLNCPQETCLDLTVENLIAGQNATFTIRNGTPGSYVFTVFGFQSGQFVTNGEFDLCATFGIKDVKQKRILGPVRRPFDNHGELIFNLQIPAQGAGIHALFQSAQRGTCPNECMSNIVETTVQ